MEERCFSTHLPQIVRDRHGKIDGLPAADQDLPLKVCFSGWEDHQNGKDVLMKLSDRYPFQEMVEQNLSGRIESIPTSTCFSFYVEHENPNCTFGLVRLIAEKRSKMTKIINALGRSIQLDHLFEGKWEQIQ